MLLEFCFTTKRLFQIRGKYEKGSQFCFILHFYFQKLDIQLPIWQNIQQRKIKGRNIKGNKDPLLMINKENNSGITRIINSLIYQFKISDDAYACIK